MKGFDLSIETFAHFVSGLSKEEQAGVSLTLIGKGEEKKTLQNLANELGINYLINWIECIPKEQVESFYVNDSVILFPSYERAGMVVPEALSYGDSSCLTVAFELQKLRYTPRIFKLPYRRARSRTLTPPPVF